MVRERRRDVNRCGVIRRVVASRGVWEIVPATVISLRLHRSYSASV